MTSFALTDPKLMFISGMKNYAGCGTTALRREKTDYIIVSTTWCNRQFKKVKNLVFPRNFLTWYLTSLQVSFQKTPKISVQLLTRWLRQYWKFVWIVFRCHLVIMELNGIIMPAASRHIPTAAIGEYKFRTWRATLYNSENASYRRKFFHQPHFVLTVSFCIMA